MTISERKIPKIRFKEFSREWEIMTLSEILKEYNERCEKNGTYEHVSLTTAGVVPKTERYERDQLVKGSDKKYRITHLDDICYNPANLKFGVICRNKYKDGIFSPIYVTFKVGEDYLPAFIEMLVTRESFIKEALQYQQGTVYERMSVSPENLLSLSVAIPEIEEQKRIGDFLDRIDNTINLYQRKIDSMIQYKNAMLQKMFPHNGTLEPEIRFPQYHDKWRVFRLGELYKERNEKGDDTLQILSVSIHTGVSDGELDEEGLGKVVRRSEDKTTYKHVYSGDLIFNMMRAWQGAIGVAKNEGMISPAYISAVPDEKVYPLFMDYALRRNEAVEQIDSLSYGITDFRKRLYWDSFIKIKCALPSVEEQKKIYEFFLKVDNFISLYQQKTEKYKELKKGLLQKMFI